jgi:hypothetical protein
LWPNHQSFGAASTSASIFICFRIVIQLSIFVTVGFITIFILLRWKYCDITICNFRKFPRLLLFSRGTRCRCLYFNLDWALITFQLESPWPISLCVLGSCLCTCRCLLSDIITASNTDLLFRIFVQLRRRHSTTSSFSISRDASHSGKKDWSSVLPPMESILKGIKCFLFEM